METASADPQYEAALNTAIGPDCPSIFITGAGGTGKSHLVMEIAKRLRMKGKQVCVTAPTGAAAARLSGQTLHAWSGVGTSTNLPALQLWAEVKSKDKCVKNWRTVDCLIIDEISMVDGRLFDRLEFIGTIVYW